MGNIRALDLFSGIGGFTLALRKVAATVAFCDNDPAATGVLKRHFPGVVVFPDVKTLHAQDVGQVDLVTAGFPCQDVSVAGQRKGLGGGERSVLYKEVIRLLREFRAPPSYVLLENVRGITNDPDYNSLLGMLDRAGYVWWRWV